MAGEAHDRQSIGGVNQLRFSEYRGVGGTGMGADANREPTYATPSERQPAFAAACYDRRTRL